MNNGPRSNQAVIMGCGRLGAALTVGLIDEGWFLHILDPNVDTFDRLPASGLRDDLVVPIVGDGTLERDLRKANTQEAGIFIAAAGRDTSNALAAQIAKHIFDVPLVICRMNDPTRREMYNNLGLVAISPMGIVTDMILEATRS